MTTPNRLPLYEDPNGAKWDRCFTDGIVKTVSGLALGLVFSGVFFKRRAWPVFLGIGIGIGMAYSTCQNDLRSPSAILSSGPTFRADRHVPTAPSDS